MNPTTPHESAAGGLRVLAVDDEPPVLDELVHQLRCDPRIDHVRAAGDATQALRQVHDCTNAGGRLDAVFLDLRMPGLNGLDLARTLASFAHPPAIVFVTAHESHAVEAFDLKAVDYLLKPVQPERLADAVQRITVALNRDAPTDPPPPVTAAAPTAAETIPVELGGVTRFIRLADVQYAQAYGDYVRLHTEAGAFLVRASMSALEKQWAEAGFVRIHRGSLIALGHVEQLSVDAGAISVSIGGRVLAVSRRYSRQVRDVLVRNVRPGARRATTS